MRKHKGATPQIIMIMITYQNRRRFLIFSILVLCFGQIETLHIDLLAQDQGLESGISLWFQM
jgi:hypothetical protein